jgi:hypothetical protein
VRAGCTARSWGGTVAWHGSPLAFLISWFEGGVSICESNNDGRWYEFGFILVIGGDAHT